MGITENVRTLALKLLGRYDEHISARLLLLHCKREGRGPVIMDMTGGPTGFTGLHGAVFLGIVEIFAAVLGMKGWDINAVDCLGNTALAWAAQRGHEVIVKILLGREDINPDYADPKFGATPLFWTDARGHEGVVEMLLEREYVVEIGCIS